MTITISSVRCALQVSLLGSVTNNLKAVKISILETNFILYFYYDNEPNDNEIDLSEIVSTEVISGYMEATAEVKRFILPEPIKIPFKEGEIFVYHRYEEYLEDN